MFGCAHHQAANSVLWKVRQVATFPARPGGDADWLQHDVELMELVCFPRFVLWNFTPRTRNLHPRETSTALCSFPGTHPGSSFGKCMSIGRSRLDVLAYTGDAQFANLQGIHFRGVNTWALASCRLVSTQSTDHTSWFNLSISQGNLSISHDQTTDWSQPAGDALAEPFWFLEAWNGLPFET